MNHAIYVLKAALKQEKSALANAKKYFKEKKLKASADEIKSFAISQELALERIPELTEAISNIARMEQLKYLS